MSIPSLMSSWASDGALGVMRTVPVTLRVCPGCGCVLAALFFPVPTKRSAFNSELLPTLGIPTTRRRTPVSGVDVYRAAPDK